MRIQKTYPYDNRRKSASSLAFLLTIVTAFALAVFPLASCKSPDNSASFGQPEPFLDTVAQDEYFRFVAFDGNRIYYEIYSFQDSTCTLWRANKDGTKKTEIATRPDSPERRELKLFGGRLYYTYLGDYDAALSSCRPDGSDVMELSSNLGYYSEFIFTGEWIYFECAYLFYQPETGSTRPVSRLYRMKLDGSSVNPIADVEGFNSFRSLMEVDSQLIYIRKDPRYDYAWVIAKRDTNAGKAITFGEGEETILTSEVSIGMGPLFHENGSICYVREVLADEDEESEDYPLIFMEICSVATQAPYIEKALVRGDFDDEFDAAFVDNGWLYYEKRQKQETWDEYGSSIRSELWRVRFDGSENERLMEQFGRVLAFDGVYMYYEALSGDGGETTVYRMKTP